MFRRRSERNARRLRSRSNSKSRTSDVNGTSSKESSLPLSHKSDRARSTSPGFHCTSRPSPTLLAPGIGSNLSTVGDGQTVTAISPNTPDGVDCAHHSSPAGQRNLLRTVFALVILLIVVYLGVIFYFTFAEDIAFAVQKQSDVILHEAMLCAEEYALNHCATEQVPMMVPKCAHWKFCMVANPTIVSRTVVVSKHFAALLEGFIEDLGPASLAIVVVVILCITYSISRR